MADDARRVPLTRQVQAELREALRRHRITQEVLAERLGVTRQAVSQYLSAPCLQTATIERLAIAAGLRVRVVFEPAA